MRREVLKAVAVVLGTKLMPRCERRKGCSVVWLSLQIMLVIVL